MDQQTIEYDMKDTGKTIYSITNKINGKSYIGYCVNFKERRTRHLKSASNGIETHLYNAIRKYGKDSFIWTALFNNLNSLEDCKIMEKRIIALFDTYNNGYNSTKGGDGGETFKQNGNKNAIRPGVFQKGNIPWNTGMTMSKEHCRILSKAQSGLKRSESHIENLTKANRARADEIRKEKSKPVRQLDFNREVISDYDSVVEANKITGINHISAVALGKQKTAGGFLWEYIK